MRNLKTVRRSVKVLADEFDEELEKMDLKFESVADTLKFSGIEVMDFVDLVHATAPTFYGLTPVLGPEILTIGKIFFALGIRSARRRQEKGL